MTLEWRRQGKEINGYNGFLRTHRIKKSFFGFGKDYVAESFLAKLPGLANWAIVNSVDDGKAWAEQHRVHWHSILESYRNRGEPA